jgi:hypothetical protein
MTNSTQALIAAGVLLWSVPVLAQTSELDFGKFVISISESPTAQVFQVVDMLSEWDTSTHKAYGRWARDAHMLNPEDRQLLERHAELRRVRGWGQGFEQAFLVDESIEMAASQAIDENILSPDEANTESLILLHFAPQVVALRRQHQAEIDAFRTQLNTERERMRPTVEKLVQFAEVSQTIRVPVFVVPNTEQNSGGGEANGGRIVVEVPSPGPMGMLLHESLHALLVARRPEIQRAAEAAGLSFTVLNEGLAYAVAPGLTDDAR